VVGNVLGQTSHTWVYDNAGGQGDYTTNFIYGFGWPFIGNPFSNGDTAQLSLGDPWPDWAAYLAAAENAGPGQTAFEEIDLDVAATTILKGNYNFSTNSVPAGEALGGDTLPNSLFRSSKPDYFGALDWPPVDPTSPPSSADPADDYGIIPAGYRFLNSAPPPEAEPGATAVSITCGTLIIG
jgi:hypothetical protein